MGAGRAREHGRALVCCTAPAAIGAWAAGAHGEAVGGGEPGYWFGEGPCAGAKNAAGGELRRTVAMAGVFGDILGPVQLSRCRPPMPGARMGSVGRADTIRAAI